MKQLLTKLLYCLFTMTCVSVVAEEELYFIDAHSQVSHNIELKEILQRMEQAGIKQTILSARRKRKSMKVAELAMQQPDKIIAAVRLKSKHYIRNTPKYYKKLKKQVKSERFNAMAEILLYHAKKGDRADEVIVSPNDERVTAALDAALDQGWPFIIHIEFASMSDGQRSLFLEQLAILLNDNQQHPFALIHMGQLNSTDVAKLIKQYQNLYFLTSHSNPIAVARSNQPWINMFQGKDMASDWKNLLIKHPDKFIFALDNVWPEQWRNGYQEQVSLWRQALSKLPSNVAHKIAHGNAEQLWGID